MLRKSFSFSLCHRVTRPISAGQGTNFGDTKKNAKNVTTPIYTTFSQLNARARDGLVHGRAKCHRVTLAVSPGFVGWHVRRGCGMGLFASLLGGGAAVRHGAVV